MAMRPTAGRSRTGGNHSWFRGIRRLLHYRMVVPIKRSAHTPEHTARGVAVGLAWAFTPTIGFQMPLVFLTWLATRKLFRWDFNVIIGMAWTWITNVVTMVPIYYVFYLTGQLMMGQSDDMTGYEGFRALWDEAFGAARGADVDAMFFSEMRSFWSRVAEALGGWGLAMAVGSLPWAAVCAWLGYVWSLRFVRRYRAMRARRRAARRAGHGTAARMSRFIHEHDPFHARPRPGDGRDGETG